MSLFPKKWSIALKNSNDLITLTCSVKSLANIKVNLSIFTLYIKMLWCINWLVGQLILDSVSFVFFIIIYLDKIVF